MRSFKEIDLELTNPSEYLKSELVNGKDKRNYKRKVLLKLKGKRKYGY